ncbi:MAG: hypothetical protein JOY80_06590 [Candidatus Dormibacteraeota bacterium]|nr:hypothetical protein [Candidatus Dormibacteraeota bacterium]
MTAPNRTPEEREALRRKLERAAAEQRRLLRDPANRKQVVSPGKWDFPIGIDPEGKPVTQPPRRGGRQR